MYVAAIVLDVYETSN